MWISWVFALLVIKWSDFAHNVNDTFAWEMQIFLQMSAKNSYKCEAMWKKLLVTLSHTFTMKVYVDMHVCTLTHTRTHTHTHTHNCTDMKRVHKKCVCVCVCVCVWEREKLDLLLNAFSGPQPCIPRLKARQISPGLLTGKKLHSKPLAKASWPRCNSSISRRGLYHQCVAQQQSQINLYYQPPEILNECIHTQAWHMHAILSYAQYKAISATSPNP